MSAEARVTFRRAFRQSRMFTMKNLPLVAAATAALTLATAVFAADNAKPNRAFSKADTNGDGKVSEAEYVAAVKDKTEETKAKTAFARRDANKDGALSADEFKVAGKKSEGDKPMEKKRKKDKE
jgi:opacity protein-like surface antigen